MVQFLRTPDARALLPEGLTVARTTRGLVGLALIAASTACNLDQPVTPVNGPGGQYGWLQIHCTKGPRSCREIAAKACPRGYEVADRRWDSSAYTAASGMDDATGAPGDDGTMIVACK